MWCSRSSVRTRRLGSMQMAVARSSGDPAFLAARSDFEIRVITARELGHIDNWRHGVADHLHERFADVIAG